MSKHRPLTIRQSLWLSVALAVVSTVLAAGALHGYQLYRHARSWEALCAQAVAQTYAAQVAPLLTAGRRAEAAAFVERVPWQTDMRLLAILDIQQQVIAARGPQVLLQRYLDTPPAKSPSLRARAWLLPSDAQGLVPEVNVADAPILAGGSSERVGTLVCAVEQGARGAPSSAAGVWRFFAGLMLIAITGAALGVLWLKRSVIRPLAALTHGLARTPGADLGADLQTDRPDEIGDVARTLAGLQTDLQQWRGRAVHLERRVSDRVAAETRRISRQLKQAEKLAWTDGLTRLGNRRLLREKFDDIFRDQREAGEDLSIIMIDIDHFKTLNDTLGHKAGDELLVFAGELLQQCLREQDLAIRYGGDEFLLILPSVSAGQALGVAERTIRMFAQRAHGVPVEPKPTMSAGIASLEEHHPDTAETLLSLADEALYSAKAAGKCCVRVFRSKPQPAAKR